MKKTAHEKDGPNRPLAHLGGLSAKQFLRDYWQKKPLLVRNAFPDLAEPLTKREVLELAQREDAESRLIAHTRAGWTLQQNPLSRRDFAAVKQDKWTVLVQDTQHFSFEAHDLLAHFDFIPHARIDDLMVSYAVPGAGVGPHIDSYDVFLLQGSGKRRWRISAQKDLRLKPGVPLKILAHFKAEQEFMLETGDLLYLPPGIAHDGVAETECLTWSVGCRAPSQQELTTALLDYLRDEVVLGGQYCDPDLAPTRQPGEIDAAMRKRVAKMSKEIQDATCNASYQQRCLGRLLTDPKQHIFFDPPDTMLGIGAFRQAVNRCGVVLDLRTRFLYSEELFFMNGNEFSVETTDVEVLRHLADSRRLSAGLVSDGKRKSLGATLYCAYRDGFLHIA
ncbi:MAG: cupin domain-containing protein [Betaproteobacteria bacterium]|nr:cupin domain-containing protein [Betaproteobacteria bacterium]